jgi:hypothetical protein
LAYLVVIELGKRAFYGAVPAQSAPDERALGDGRRHLRRRAPTSAMRLQAFRGEHTACGEAQRAVSHG